MKLFNQPIDPHSKVSIGNQILGILRQEIKAGRWRNGERLPTARELSRLTGVSPATASKALAVLAEEGEVDRQVGRGSYLRSVGVKRRRSGIIGIVQGASWIPGMAVFAQYPFFHHLIEQIDRELSKWDCKCRIFHEHSLRQVSQVDDREISESDFYQVDGIINLGSVPQSLLDMVKSASLPLVCVGTTETPDGVPYVGVDDRHEIWSAVDRFVQAGHRKIGMIHSYPELKARRLRSRYDAFIGACIQAGCPPKDGSILDMGLEDGSQLMRVKEYLSAKDRPTAVLCTYRAVARTVYEAAGLLGLKIPEHLSVIGLVPLGDLGENYQPPLSVIVTNGPAMAKKAVQTLLEMVKTGEPSLCEGNLVRSIWKPRASVSAPPRG